MNFSECVQTVLAMLKRPDKIVVAEAAVNAALSRAILRTEFPQDLVETSIPIDSTKYDQTIDLSALVSPLTRFRKWKYIKQPGQLAYLQPIPPDKIFSPGRFVQQDCYYMAGSNLTIIPTVTSATLEVGYYSYAPALKNNETFWLLDVCPYAIIYLACAICFESIGDMQAAGANEKNGINLLRTLEPDMQYGHSV
mgnify:FL=1|jgi:hypothetical protein